MKTVGDWTPDFQKRQRDLLEFVRSSGIVKGNALNLFGFLVEKSGDYGACFWGNEALRYQFKCTTRSIQKWLSILEKEGLVRCRYLSYGAELPFGNGEVVETRPGIRLIVTIGLWKKEREPGRPLNRDSPSERKRKSSSTKQRRIAKRRVTASFSRGMNGQLSENPSSSVAGMNSYSSRRDEHPTHRNNKVVHGGDEAVFIRKEELLIEGSNYIDVETENPEQLEGPVFSMTAPKPKGTIGGESFAREINQKEKNKVDAVLPLDVLGLVREWPEDAQEEFDERAAIIEHEGSISRQEAEESAYRLVQKKLVAGEISGRFSTLPERRNAQTDH